MINPSEVKIIELKPGLKYQRLFNKDSGTRGIKAGHVILKKGEEVGEHSTGDVEEVLVILEGNGELVIDKDRSIKIKDKTVLYIPPEIVHNVKNTGKGMLEYIFITS